MTKFLVNHHSNTSIWNHPAVFRCGFSSIEMSGWTSIGFGPRRPRHAKTLPASAAFPSFKMVVIKNKLLGPGSWTPVVILGKNLEKSTNWDLENRDYIESITSPRVQEKNGVDSNISNLRIWNQDKDHLQIPDAGWDWNNDIQEQFSGWWFQPLWKY